MRSTILLRRILLAVVLLGLTLSVAFFLHTSPESSISEESALVVEDVAVVSNAEQVQLQEEVVAELPMRIKIPSINVDAPIEYVGITPDGAMDVPKEQANVAWFELGRRPGENGSAVIAGHYGWKNGEPSVFDNLHTLRKGDKIYIEDEKGAIITFVMRESRRYDPDADASDVFISTDGKAHLNLITCEGEWNSVTKTYSKRLVIFADKE